MRHVIATPSQTKAILQRHGMTAKKSYGQNFLIDAGIVEKIARSAVVSDHCAVIEIGPGIGALTQFLCEYAAKVIAFEIDERLPAVLADTLGEYDNVELVMEDFLQTDLSARVEELRAQGYDVVIAANLPYYITTPIIMHILENSIHAESITVMMQKEVADRIKASPGNKTYGAISVAVQYYCEVEQVISVPKEVFVPRPKVDSAVLKLTIRKETPVDLIDEKAFFACIKAGFGQRRKTLLNSLTGTYGLSKDEIRTILEKAGIDPVRRAETLDMNEFADIANGVASAKQTI